MEGIVVVWEGINITSEVISYTRDNNICTGVGTLDLTIVGTSTRNFQTWDTIILEEGDDPVGTYNLCSREKSAPDGTFIITCQDNSKRLTDYFIDHEIKPTRIMYTRELLVEVLGASGVSYSLAGGNGQLVSMDSTFGMQPAYEAVISLLQLSGWYMYFDANGVCRIGPLSVPESPQRTFNDTLILSIKKTKNDKMLRNKAIVWGSGESDFGWVHATSQTQTPWNRGDGEDYRTVVYANSAIRSFSVAKQMADEIVDEFSKTTPETVLDVAGVFSDVRVGHRLTSTSNFYSFSGMVSSIHVTAGESGAITSYTIDERCPRMFGYATFLGGEIIVRNMSAQNGPSFQIEDTYVSRNLSSVGGTTTLMHTNEISTEYADLDEGSIVRKGDFIYYHNDSSTDITNKKIKVCQYQISTGTETVVEVCTYTETVGSSRKYVDISIIDDNIIMVHARPDSVARNIYIVDFIALTSTISLTLPVVPSVGNAFYPPTYIYSMKDLTNAIHLFAVGIFEDRGGSPGFIIKGGHYVYHKNYTAATPWSEVHQIVYNPPSGGVQGFIYQPPQFIGKDYLVFISSVTSISPNTNNPGLVGYSYDIVSETISVSTFLQSSNTNEPLVFSSAVDALVGKLYFETYLLVTGTNTIMEFDPLLLTLTLKYTGSDDIYPLSTLSSRTKAYFYNRTTSQLYEAATQILQGTFALDFGFWTYRPTTNIIDDTSGIVMWDETTNNILIKSLSGSLVKTITTSVPEANQWVKVHDFCTGLVVVTYNKTTSPTKKTMKFYWVS